MPAATRCEELGRCREQSLNADGGRRKRILLRGYARVTDGATEDATASSNAPVVVVFSEEVAVGGEILTHSLVKRRLRNW
jgi:hypothetical protein